MHSFQPPPPHVTSCGVPVAYVRVVDGMPFVEAMRPTLRLKLDRGPSPGTRQVYILYDRTRAVARIDVSHDETGTHVEVQNAAPYPNDPATAIVLDTRQCRHETARSVNLADSS